MTAYENETTMKGRFDMNHVLQSAQALAHRLLTSAVACAALMVPAMAQDKARLGTNLTGVEDFYSNVPFIDAFKQSRPWYTQRDGSFDTNEAERLQLDDSGWLKTQFNFTIIFIVIFLLVEGYRKEVRYFHQ